MRDSTPQARPNADRTRSATARSSASRLRAPFSSVTEWTVTVPSAHTATWTRWSPFRGRSVASAAVQATPTTGASARGRRLTALSQAFRAMADAVSTDTACRGAAPRNPARDRSP